MNRLGYVFKHTLWLFPFLLSGQLRLEPSVLYVNGFSGSADNRSVSETALTWEGAAPTTITTIRQTQSSPPYITFFIYRDDGTSIYTNTFTLEPFKPVHFYIVANAYGIAGDFVHSEVVSFRSSTGHATNLTIILDLMPVGRESRKQAKVIPHIAVGADWQTQLYITGQSDHDADLVTLEFYDSKGAPLPLNIRMDDNSYIGRSSVTFQMWVASTQRIDLVSPSGALLTGYAVANFHWRAAQSSITNACQGSVNVVYRHQIQAGFMTEAAIQTKELSYRPIAYPIDRLGGYSYGLAMVNTTSIPAKIRLYVVNDKKQYLVKEDWTLQPAEHRAVSIDYLVSAAQDNTYTLYLDPLQSSVSLVLLRFAPNGAFIPLQ